MPAEAGDPITPEQIDEIYRTLIRPTLFDASPGGESTPTLVLLGAQPGSGKSRASARILSEHAGMVAVSGEDLRIYHSNFRDLVTNQPEQAGPVLAEATRPWVRAAIQDSLDERRSLLLEGPFGDPDVTLATAARFRDAGFEVRIVAIASPRVLSLVTVASRYLRARKMDSPARFTRLSAHDHGYDGTTRLIDSLDAATPADQVTIVSRNGSTLLDRTHDTTESSDSFAGAREALSDGRHPVSWGAHSTMELLGELKQITTYAIASGALTRDTSDLLVEAHTLALSEVLPRLSIDADSPQARFIQQAVAEQLVTVRRAAADDDLVASEIATQPTPAISSIEVDPD